MIELLLLMKIFILINGEYDQWNLIITTLPNINCFGTETIGCTESRTKTITIVEKYINAIDTYGNPILWHEIKHAQCNCNWHFYTITNLN